MNVVLQPTHTKIECPRCHAPAAFGPTRVFGQYWVTRCAKCRYDLTIPFPKITKKIVYLDQFALSNILKGTDPRWTTVTQKLRLLLYLQVIACPSSKIHREESLLAEKSREAHKELYRDLSGGVEFRPPFDIQQDQLLEAMRRFLDGDSGPGHFAKAARWQEYCKSDPHDWTPDLGIYADFPHDPARVARLQKHKDDLHSDLVNVAANWKTESNTFEQDVQREASCYGNGLIEAYRHLAGWRGRIEEMMPPEMREAFVADFGPVKFDPRTPPGIQPGVQLVHWLAAEAHRARSDDSDPVAVVEQFFQSQAAMAAPFQYISTRLWATIAQKVRNAKGSRQPKPSDDYDVTAIATYAPYCDAMIVDNEFCAMASQRNIDVPRKFGVRLFCSRTLVQFEEYLDDLIANIPSDHQKAVKQVYPHLDGLRCLNDDDGHSMDTEETA